MFGQVDHAFDRIEHVVDALRAQELAEQPDARIEEDFESLQHLIDRLEVERLRRLAEVQRRGLFERDGHLSAVSWLASAHGVPRSAAAADVRTARSLSEMPSVDRALGRGEICRSWLGRPERPTVAGERPHISVTVDSDDLVAGRSGELDLAGPVVGRVIRRLACDVSVVRVLMSGRSEPLDVGRRTAVVSSAMRSACAGRVTARSTRAVRDPRGRRARGRCEPHSPDSSCS
jgi:hypothetical protein